MVHLKADLHCHSLFSDGVLTPDELVRRAVSGGVQLFALTDHDTVSGSAQLQEAAAEQGLKVISGIELSVRWKTHDIHILGLNIESENPILIELLKKQMHARKSRAQQIAQLLELKGIKDVYQKACALAGHERIGRPHLAQVLINEGMVKDMSQAFKRYLGRGRSAYIPTPWLSVEECVHGIMEAKGVAVIAHPLKYRLTRTKLHRLIDEFKIVGGLGVEVVSGEMDEQQVNEVAMLCNAFELLASTGSDYHSDAYSRVGIGRQRLLPTFCEPIWKYWGIS